MFMSVLKNIPLQLLCAVLFALGAYASGYYSGGASATAKHELKQAKADKQARAAYDAKQRQGEQAAAAYLEADRALATQFQTLTEKFNVLRRTTPLVTYRPGLFACNSGGAIRPQPDASSPAQPYAPDAPAPAIQAAPDDTGIALTAGAVWMWNSALTGVDQPTHSCGALDPTSPACAAGTSLTLDAAWDNHITNAQVCAANRLAHQSLIDFIHRQQAAPSIQQQKTK
jgi:hypothetical protein